MNAAGRMSDGDVVPINLRDVYQTVGKFDVKMLIDKDVSSRVESVTVQIINADGTVVPVEYRRWGTKLTLSFSIDENVPDGVATIAVILQGRDGSKDLKRFIFWVVK